MAVMLWTVAPLVVLHIWWWLRCKPLFKFQLAADVLVLAVVAPALFRGADLNPVRCLSRNQPFTSWQWSEATELQPTQSDLVLQFHPWWEQARRRIHTGTMPLIASEIGGGLPLLANGQTGFWAPMMAPVWALGVERGTTVMAMWKLEVAAIGAFLFLWRGWRLRWSAAAVGGLAFGGSAYQVAWLLVPLSWVVAATPWTWWAVTWALRKRVRLRASMLVGLFLAWLVGSGLHPETAVIVVGSCVLVGLVSHPRRWRRLALMLIVALPVGLALAWPTIGYIAASSRNAVAVDQSPNRTTLPVAVRTAAFRQMLVPAVNGHPGRGDWTAPYPHAAGATGVGGAALALLAAGAARPRYRRLLWSSAGCMAVALVLAYRVPPLDWALVRIPPLDRMTLHRFAALVPWALAVMAAVSLDGALSGRRRRLPWRLVPVIVLTAVAASGALSSLAAADRWLVVLSVLAAAAAVVPFLGRWMHVVVVAELALLALGINPVATVEDRNPLPPVVQEVVRLQEREGGRITGLGGFLPANLAGRYGVADLRAYDPLRPLPYARMTRLLGEPEMVLGGPLRRTPAGFCGAWSVRFLVARQGREAPGWQPVWSGDSGIVWRNPRYLDELRVVGTTVPETDDSRQQALRDEIDFSTTAIVAAGGSSVAARDMVLAAEEVSETLVRARVSCDGPCLVVLARPWAPGWHARVDGERAPLQVVNIAGLGVMSPAGTHTVELGYNPWRWSPGNVREATAAR